MKASAYRLPPVDEQCIHVIPGVGQCRNHARAGSGMCEQHSPTPRAPRAVNESQIQQAIRIALGDEPDLVLWRNTTGQTEEWNPSDGSARTLRYGLAVGSADLVGILRVCPPVPCCPECRGEDGWGPSRPVPWRAVGVFFALEVKTPTGRVRPEQTQWLELVRRMGGFAAVVRSVDEAKEALARARNGESE